MNKLSFRNTSDPENNKHRRGHGSYWLQGPELIFTKLGLKEGDCFLDLGCGPGDYAIRAAGITGDSGKVYALDISASTINNLNERVNSHGLKNLSAMVSDITGPLPIADNLIDVCFIATALHIPGVAKQHKTLFNDISRVLKPDGCVAIIECKKEDMPFGPPRYLRLSPEETEALVVQHGFQKISLTDLGHNYMIRFKLL